MLILKGILEGLWKWPCKIKTTCKVKNNLTRFSGLVAFHENDGNYENDKNDEDNSDSHKQGVECCIGGNRGNHGNDDNHGNPGCKPRVPQTRKGAEKGEQKRIRSGPGKPNQRKTSSWTFRRGIPEQKFNVNCACFPKEKHQNSQKWAKFMNFSFRPFLWFGLPGWLLRENRGKRADKQKNGDEGWKKMRQIASNNKIVEGDKDWGVKDF